MTFAGQIEAAIVVPTSTTISVTSNSGGPTTVTIAAATYVGITAFCTYLQSALIAQRSVSGGTWTVAVSTGASGTGKVTIAVTNGTYSITWSSTNLRDYLGFTAGNIAAQTTVTGASAARGLWIPDNPLAADSDIKQAPTETDTRACEGPTGLVTTLAGCDKYVLTGLIWDNVAINRIWIGEETTPNQSYERFYRDCIRGNGHAWFTPGSAVKIYDHRGYYAGQGSSIVSWTPVNVPALSALKMSQGRWTGYWRVEWPRLVTAA